MKFDHPIEQYLRVGAHELIEATILLSVVMPVKRGKHFPEAIGQLNMSYERNI